MTPPSQTLHIFTQWPYVPPARDILPPVPPLVSSLYSRAVIGCPSPKSPPDKNRCSPQMSKCSVEAQRYVGLKEVPCCCKWVKWGTEVLTNKTGSWWSTLAICHSYISLDLRSTEITLFVIFDFSFFVMFKHDIRYLESESIRRDKSNINIPLLAALTICVLSFTWETNPRAIKGGGKPIKSCKYVHK